MWNRDLLDRPEAYAEALDRWLAYYRELGIEQLGYACLVLRKRADGRDGWFEAQPLPQAALRPAGRHVRRLFETHDRLSELDSDDALLERRLRVVDDAVVTQETRFARRRLARRTRSRSGSTADCRSRPSSTDPRRGSSASSTGRSTLREALAAAVDGDEARAAGLVLARQMLEIGFLELATDVQLPTRRAAKL